MAEKKQLGTEHMASAKGLNLSISTKQSVEISYHLRYRDTSFAKQFLEEVVKLKKAVPFRRFTRDIGHKPGISAGRFPQKAASEFLKLIKSVEANAQAKGLNTSNLKIIKLLANKASVPLTGGRNRRGTKRTHLEIQVKEGREKKTDRKFEKKGNGKQGKSEPEKSAPAEEKSQEIKSENNDQLKENKDSKKESKGESKDKPEVKE